MSCPSSAISTFRHLPPPPHTGPQHVLIDGPDHLQTPSQLLGLTASLGCSAASELLGPNVHARPDCRHLNRGGHVKGTIQNRDSLRCRT